MEPFRGISNMALVSTAPSVDYGSPLRVAVLAPLAWRVPPRHYGPWELFCSLLTEGLVAAGHDVTLFATGDSVTSATLVSTCEKGWSEDATVDPKVAECIHIANVFERAAQFDIIHNSFDFLPLTYSSFVHTPVVTTIHGFSSEKIVEVYLRYNGSGHYVAIVRPINIRACDTAQRSTTASTQPHFSRTSPLVGRCCFLAGSTPTREQRPLLRSPGVPDFHLCWPALFRTRSISIDMSSRRSTVYRSSTEVPSAAKSGLTC